MDYNRYSLLPNFARTALSFLDEYWGELNY